MASLRDKLKGYGASSARTAPAAEKRRADCYRVFDVTPAADYGLSDPLPRERLYLAGGLALDRDVPLDRVLFLDTETTGLSGGAGTLAFLTGLGSFSGGRFTVEQDLIRNYDEEPAMLERIAALLDKTELLVTFNGRTFDMPLLESRMIMNGRRLKTDIPHLDLLHAARAVWKLRLRRCSLSALEQAVLGLERTDDLPGAEVPKAYFDYLKTGCFSLLEPILAHNCQDIRSLPLLLKGLMDVYRAPDQARYSQDVYSAGRVLEKRGMTEQARRCYRAADTGTVSAIARLRLADSHRRTAEFREAADVYQRMLDSGQGTVEVMVRLAILCEHRLGRLRDALRLTERAMLMADSRDGTMDELIKRYDRLKHKIERMERHGTDGHVQGQESADLAPERRI